VFKGGKVINDAFAKRPVVLIGNTETRTVRAYEREQNTFSGSGEALKSGGGLWQIGEEALTGPNGEKLDRIAGHLAFWFAWDGYLGAGSSLYGSK
jgi:Protein of unknown function (DUF3179)